MHYHLQVCVFVCVKDLIWCILFLWEIKCEKKEKDYFDSIHIQSHTWGLMIPSLGLYIYITVLKLYGFTQYNFFPECLA